MLFLSLRPTLFLVQHHPIRKRNSRSLCADFAAHGPGLSNRECHWIAPVLLPAVQPSPWLRPATSYSPYGTRQTSQRDRVAGQPRQTKNKTNSRTSQPPKDTRGGGCHGGKVCVHWWGRQHSAIPTQSPTQGRSLCCHEEKWRQETDVTTLHTTKHDNRAVARYNQICENFWHLWWDESIWSFCIGRSEFAFHLDGELNRDDWHCICTSHILHVLLEMMKPNNNMFFVFFEYFDCTENTVRIWICIVTWKIKPFSISFALVSTGEVHEGIVRRS